MKKVASVWVLSMLLASFMLMGVAFAQTDTATVTVTVNQADSAVTLSPNTVTAGQKVTFEFADGGMDLSNYCVVVLGADSDTPLNVGATGAADMHSCMTYTFANAGAYRVAVFNNVDLSGFTFGADTKYATLTVNAAQATVTPEATAMTTTAAGAITTTTTMTTTDAVATAAPTPATLPTTGGETDAWVPLALVLAAVALMGGGLMRVAMRNR